MLQIFIAGVQYITISHVSQKFCAAPRPGIGNKAKQREPALFNFSSNGIYFLGMEYVCGGSHGQILLLGIIST